jgi:membrane protease YdiL (CAAX protease family)
MRFGSLGVFFVLAFALSWGFLLLWYLTSSPVMFFFGGLGPAMAAAVVSWRLGTLQPWLARVLRWRVSPRFYLFAFGFPVLLYGVPNVVLAVFGAQPDLSLLGERLPAYGATWVAALFMGGLEEPGWRGFALPRLQQRYSPVRATLLLGVVWGLWHLPVAPLAIVVTLIAAAIGFVVATHGRLGLSDRVAEPSIVAPDAAVVADGRRSRS